MIIKKHKKIDSRDSAKESGFIHLVSIPWKGQKEYWWNQACADVVEVFGLPGGRFTSHPKMNQMNFLFKSEKDADLCRILLSDKI